MIKARERYRVKERKRERNVEKEMREKKRVRDTRGQNCSLGGEMKGGKKDVAKG